MSFDIYQPTDYVRKLSAANPDTTPELPEIVRRFNELHYMVLIDIGDLAQEAEIVTNETVKMAVLEIVGEANLIIMQYNVQTGRLERKGWILTVPGNTGRLEWLADYAANMPKELQDLLERVLEAPQPWGNLENLGEIEKVRT